jgi:hypothetical protein
LLVNARKQLTFVCQPPTRARSDIRYSKPHAQSNVIRL